MVMIRAALVGVSGYGRWHLLMAMEQALLGRLRLVGATIINQAAEPTITARLQRQGVRVFARYDEMLAALSGQVDLVLIPTAIQWHAPMTLAALQRGLHVLVEKPLATTLHDVDRIIAARDAARRIVGIGFQDLYVPATHDIKRRLLRGDIGAVRRVVIRAQWPRPTEYYGRNTWAGRVQCDGAWVLDSPVSNAHAHFVLLALFWAGSQPHLAAEIAMVQAELYRVNAIETFDTVSLRAWTADGVELLFYGTHAGVANVHPEICVFGDAGHVRWVYEREYTIHTVAGEECFRVPEQLDTRLSVLESVVARINGHDTFIVEPELARGHTLLINALQAFFAVRDIGADHQFVRVEAGGEYRCISGVDEAIATAVDRGALFSELGLPWAVPAAAQPTAGYAGLTPPRPSLTA